MGYVLLAWAIVGAVFASVTIASTIRGRHADRYPDDIRADLPDVEYPDQLEAELHRRRPRAR